MNPDLRGVARIVLQSCVIGLPLLLMVPTRGHAAERVDEVSCEPSFQSRVDAQLAAKAEEGGAALGQFVRRTQTVHQLDYAEAVRRVERHRRAAAACTLASNAKS